MSLAAPSLASPRERTPVWILVLLFASLAANLLVIGSVGTALWRFRGPPPPAEFGPPNLIGYASSLRGERYKAVWEATAQVRQKLRPIRQELRAARNDVTAAVVAEPFDNAAFEAAQARLVEKENAARQATLALHAEIVKHLTPAERRFYGTWREHRRMPPMGILEDGEGHPGEGSPFRHKPH